MNSDDKGAALPALITPSEISQSHDELVGRVAGATKPGWFKSKDEGDPLESDCDRRERRLKQAGMMDVQARSVGAHRPDDPMVEFSFELKCGAVMRCRMAKDSARFLAVGLHHALFGREMDQSGSSSGMPRNVVSPQEGHEP